MRKSHVNYIQNIISCLTEKNPLHYSRETFLVEFKKIIEW